MRTLTSIGLWGGLRRFVGRLRSSQLMMIVAGLFLLDLVVVDPIPFVDELVLFAAMLLLDRWKAREKPAPKPPTKNVTDRAKRS